VWFPCGNGGFEQVAVVRSGAEAPVDRLRVAVEALLDGPSEAEADQGLVAIVPPGSAELLDEVEYVDDGLATISFSSRLTEVNNLSTSSAAGAFLRSIETTALALPEVTGVELQVEGDCNRFFAFLESTCHHLAEPLPEFPCPVIEPPRLPSGAAPTAARPYPGQPLVVWGSGTDAVTGTVSEGEPRMAGVEAQVRGHDAWVRATGDAPLPEPYEITWAEDGCTYSMYVRVDGGEEAALAFARRLGAADELVGAVPVTRQSEADGVLLTVTLSADRIVEGEVLFATTTVENRSALPRHWASNGGDCDWAVSAQVFPVVPLQRGAAWSGDLGRLKRGLLGLWGVPEHLLATPHTFVTSRRLPDLSTGCFPETGAIELAPGTTRTDELAWRPTGPLGMPLPPGTYEVRAHFRRVLESNPNVAVPDTASVVIPIEVVGPSIDYLDPGLAIDVALADAEFRGLLEEVRRERWMRTNMEFEDEVWRITVPIGEQSAWNTLDYTIVAEIDATGGEVLDVRVVDR
jgi:hypothetical protein